MRTIKFIILHCTAGPLYQSVAEIQNYWRRSLGWKNNGYHHIITQDGVDHYITPIEQISNGVAGYNKNSINIATTGGVDAKGKPFDNRTPEQLHTEINLVESYKARFPNAIVLGHRDFSTDKNGNGIIEQWEWIKSCPAYDVRDWLASIGREKAIIPVAIIYKLNYPLVKNSKVKEIQLALNKSGAKLKADGVFGVSTEFAVRVFQKQRGMKDDGIVGPKTAEALNIRL